MATRRPDLKAQHLLRENIRILLSKRNQDASELAAHCGRDKSWINKILNEHRGMPLIYIDRVADFFGYEAYQLFQPGLSHLTERRSGVDRRTNTDRRIGVKGRLLHDLRLELNKLPPRSGDDRSVRLLPAGGDTLPEPVRKIIERANREIADYYLREDSTQNVRASTKRGAVATRRSRTHGRSDAE